MTYNLEDFKEWIKEKKKNEQGILEKETAEVIDKNIRNIKNFNDFLEIKKDLRFSRGPQTSFLRDAWKWKAEVDALEEQKKKKTWLKP